MKYKRKPGYYHDSCLEFSDLCYFDDTPCSMTGNWSGPFKTMTQCKEDAIDYHKVDLNSARGAIEAIRKLKKKDIEIC